MREFDKAVNTTQEYAAKYGQILDDDQLFLRLIASRKYQRRKFIGKGRIKMNKNEEYSKKITKAQELVKKYLSKIPGILMVGITGSVAAETVQKNEDIDLLIVSKAGEMWWWRLYLRWFFWKKRIPHRRFRKKEKGDEFCVNLWLDDDNLLIPRNRRNLKNACDLIMMKIIYDKNCTYQKFLRKNGWVEKYLATGYNSRLGKCTPETTIDKTKKVVKLINKILYIGQYVYMVVHSGKWPRDIKIGQAFFHEEK